LIPAPRAAHCPLQPPTQFSLWREQPGLRRVINQGRPTWAVSRYRDIRDALLDPRLSADTMPDYVKPAGTTDTPVMFARADDPEHHRIRRMMTGDFTFRRCEAMRPQIQQLVDHFLDEMIATGPPSDLVRNFALPVPSLVIALMLGVPTDDLGRFQGLTTVGLNSGSTDQDKAAAFAAMYGYIEQLVRHKEDSPGDDLISRLVRDFVVTGQISRETAALSGMTLLVAGHETTANMISLGTVALLEHHDVFERLGQTDDRAVVANIVEELMRYLTIVHSQVDRVATEDLTLGGQTVRAGDFLVMNLPAGNWDAEFVDRPEVFDIERNPRGHLGFGYGVHQCLGANLARVEMQVAFTTLARRLPGLEVAAPPEQLKFKGESQIYGMRELPVRW
jgi:cytochrome P450